MEREGVAPVPVDWAAVVSPGRERMKEVHLEDNVEMWRVEARKAYQTLKAVTDGWRDEVGGNSHRQGGNPVVVPKKPQS